MPLNAGTETREIHCCQWIARVAVLFHDLRYASVHFVELPRNTPRCSKRPDKPSLAYRVALTCEAMRNNAALFLAHLFDAIPYEAMHPSF
jgi:hypothetical protein